jgi:hypothetical protein
VRTLSACRLAALSAVLLSSYLLAAPPRPASAGDAKPQPAAHLDRIKEEIRTRAVVKIERPEGVCYWQIMGADSLLRMPVKDAGFATLLLSAQIVGDKLQVAAAGESQPLETTLLGRYSLQFKGEGREAAEKAVPADALRFGGREPWRLGIMPPADFIALHTKGGVAGCCKCEMYKVTCCPNAGACLSCGTCGDCCGD